MARRGRCLFWAAVGGLAVGFVAATVQTPSPSVEAASRVGDAASSAPTDGGAPVDAALQDSSNVLPSLDGDSCRTMGGTLVLVDGLDEIGTIPVVDGTMIVVGSNTVDGNTQDSMDVMMDVAMGSDTVDGNTLDNVDVMMDVATVVGRMVDGNAIPADGMMDMAGMDTSNGMLVARPPGRGLVAVPLNNAGTMFALIGEVVGRVTETGMVRAKGLVVLVGWLLHGREVRPVRDQVLPRHLMRRGVRVSPPRQRLRRVNKNQVDVDCRIDRVFPRLPLGFGSKGCGSSDSALSLKNANNEAVKGRYALLDGRGCAPNGWMARLGRLLSLAEWIVAVPQRLGPALLLLRSWLVLTVPLVGDEGTLLVDWVSDGLPEHGDGFFFYEDDDDVGFLQLGDAFVDAEAVVFMELTDREETLLDELHIPDAVRGHFRRMLQTLERRDVQDEGPEFRWSSREWLAAWDAGCADAERVLRCLRRRVGADGPVEYYPVVRTPRAAAQRVRALNWARTWTRVATELVEALVDCEMVQRVDTVPVQPQPRSRSRSRTRSPAAVLEEGSSSSTDRRWRVTRARRRVGTADGPGPALASGDGAATGEPAMSTPDVPNEDLPPVSVPVSAGSAMGETANSEAAVNAEDADAEDVTLVQRLQPAEARELQRLGVRRDTITALGLFLGELASICDNTHPGSDVMPEDVQWALRVVERAMHLSAGTQDFISAILASRLRRQNGGCILPDGDGRGGVVQMAHTFLIGTARTYLDDLHNLLADAWVNPESLPAELRREPPAGYGDTTENVDEVMPVVVAPVRPAGPEVDVETDAPRPVVPPPPDAILATTVEADNTVDVTVHVEATGEAEGETEATGETSASASSSWVVPPARTRSRSPRRPTEDTDEVNMVQLLRMDEHEALAEASVPPDVRGRLDAFFQACNRCVDTAWTMHLGVAILDAQLRQLGVLRCLLAERAGRPRPLPGEASRRASADACVVLARAVAATQWDVSMMEVCHARCDPDVLPERLHGCALPTTASTDGVDAPFEAPAGSEQCPILRTGTGRASGEDGPVPAAGDGVSGPALPGGAGAHGGGDSAVHHGIGLTRPSTETSDVTLLSTEDGPAPPGGASGPVLPGGAGAPGGDDSAVRPGVVLSRLFTETSDVTLLSGLSDQRERSRSPVGGRVG
ncbi:UPF1 [Symbiodinium microadriaticum]|nr:UPF1 [Symbiodinium microadriaticum]CAE7251062.1 UPF1 [Symbiodinium sp. KB8]